MEESMENNLVSECEENDIQFAENESVGEVEQQPSSEEKRKLLKNTKIIRQTWSIQEIYRKIENKQLKLDPDYQRNKIWKQDKKIAFIESLFMGIIVPPIYVVEIPGENMLSSCTYEIVDGKQRLTAIYEFLCGKYKLQGKYLEYYEDWFGGKSITEIERDYQENTYEMLSSALDVYVISANSPEFTKYDIFSRLNKGAEQLRVNEIRRAIYRSETLSVIDEFVVTQLESEESTSAKRYNDLFTPTRIKRFEDLGRFYTSLAFFQQSKRDKGLVENYNSRPRDMINNVLQDIQDKKIVIDKDTVNTILERTLDLMEKMKGISGADYIINSCIPFVIEDWKKLIDKIDSIIEDDIIKSSLANSPATTSNVNLRLKRVQEILQQ